MLTGRRSSGPLPGLALPPAGQLTLAFWSGFHQLCPFSGHLGSFWSPLAIRGSCVAGGLLQFFPALPNFFSAPPPPPTRTPHPGSFVLAPCSPSAPPAFWGGGWALPLNLQLSGTRRANALRACSVDQRQKCLSVFAKDTTLILDPWIYYSALPEWFPIFYVIFLNNIFNYFNWGTYNEPTSFRDGAMKVRYSNHCRWPLSQNWGLWRFVADWQLHVPLAQQLCCWRNRWSLFHCNW